MDIKNLKTVNFPIELDLGLPYIKDEEVAKVEIYSHLPPGERITKIWDDIGSAGMPYARGLLLIPLSGNTPPYEIPERKGDANWDDERADEAVVLFESLFTDDFVSIINDDGVDSMEYAGQLLASVGLVTGTVSLVIPLFPSDLAEWNKIKDFEQFVQGLNPEWIGLYPNSRKKGPKGFTLNRLQPDVFDLSAFKITEEAFAQNRRGIFLAGYAPGKSDVPDVNAMRRCQQIPVPFSSENKNIIAGDNKNILSKKEINIRKNTAKSEADIGLAGMLYSCPTSRTKDWEREMPGVWSKLYPRRFADIPGYPHPKTIARHNAALLFPSAWPDGNVPNGIKSALVLPKVMRFFCPHYFIAPSMVEAISSTKFPDDLKPNEVPLPVPALMLVLPDSGPRIMGADGTPILYILLVNRTKSEISSELIDLLRLADPKASDESINLFLLNNTPEKSGDELVVIGISSSGPQLFELAATWLVSDIVTESSVLSKFGGYPDYMAAASFCLLRFVLNCLLYFNSVPQYHESERILHSVRAKPTLPQKGSIDYWQPNIYGRKFQFPPKPVETPELGEANEVTGRKPRPHLRAAHWRRQWHGSGMSQLKWVYIDFSWVNARDDPDAVNEQ